MILCSQKPKQKEKTAREKKYTDQSYKLMVQKVSIRNVYFAKAIRTLYEALNECEHAVAFRLSTELNHDWFSLTFNTNKRKKNCFDERKQRPDLSCSFFLNFSRSNLSFFEIELQ